MIYLPLESGSECLVWIPEGGARPERRGTGAVLGQGVEHPEGAEALQEPEHRTTFRLQARRYPALLKTEIFTLLLKNRSKMSSYY